MGPAVPEVTILGGIACIASGACTNAQITVTNNGCNKVVIEAVECGFTDSCNGANFNLIGDIDIQACELGPTGEAVTTGLKEKCNQNLEMLICQEGNACNNLVKTITNPLNGFGLLCDAPASCSGAQLTLDLNEDPTKPSPVANLDAFIFSGEQSGAGATITINNNQGINPLNLQPYTVEVDTLDCRGVGACNGLTVNTGSNVIIGDIFCFEGTCDGCTINGSPCLIPTIPTRPTAPSSNPCRVDVTYCPNPNGGGSFVGRDPLNFCKMGDCAAAPSIV